MSARSDATHVRIHGKQLALTNLDKLMYPKAGFTKADVIAYYADIASVLLPHLKNRALTLKRYPDGVEGGFFYEKKCPSHRPTWVRTTGVWSDVRGEPIAFCVANDLPTLVWAANLADLELHTSLARARSPDRPTMMVFDLDPGAPAGLVECADVALRIRALLKADGLRAWCKTSGSKGLQVYVPVNSPVTYDRTKAYARAIAQTLEESAPDTVTSRMSKALRRGKVFVDWSQNDRHKTTVCAYSLRAKDHPTVSTPVTWVEIERAARTRSADGLVFDTAAVLRRVRAKGDLFGDVLTVKQKVPRVQ